LSRAAEKLGKTIVVTPNRVQESMAVVQNEKKGKVVVLFDVSSVSPDEPVKSFVIDPAQYVWADDEGFSLQDMYEKLGDRVFIEIPFVGVLAYLLCDSNII